MDKKALRDKVEADLQVLCSEIGERRVGSEENRRPRPMQKKYYNCRGGRLKRLSSR